MKLRDIAEIPKYYLYRFYRLSRTCPRSKQINYRLTNFGYYYAEDEQGDKIANNW